MGKYYFTDVIKKPFPSFFKVLRKKTPLAVVLILAFITFITLVVANQTGFLDFRSRAASQTYKVTYQPLIRTDIYNQEGTTGSIYNGETAENWIGTGSDPASSYLGLRFSGDSIPAGAQITNAQLVLTSIKNQWIRMRFDIFAEDTSDPATFTEANPPSQRSLTSNFVPHNSNTRWSKNKPYVFNVTQPIRELYDSVGHSNTISLILKGKGSRWGRKFVYNNIYTQYQPKLVISYTLSSSAPSQPPTPPQFTPTPILERFTAGLSGAQEVPSNSSSAIGTGVVVLESNNTAKVSLNFSALSSTQTAAHIHGPAARGQNAGILFTLPSGNFTNHTITLTNQQIQYLRQGQLYFNVHTTQFPNGEIRGQIESPLFQQPTPTVSIPAPTGVKPTPTTAPTHVPDPGHGGNAGVGRCGESNDTWHAPVVSGCTTGHEHGDAPPDWVQNSPRKAMFTHTANTPNENILKHTSFKGMLGRMNGVDVYVVAHLDTNPNGHTSRFHSIQIWTRDPSNNVSYWQGWMDLGQGTQTGPNLRAGSHCGGDDNIRPIISVNYPDCNGVQFESWYFFMRGGWTWDGGFNMKAQYHNGPRTGVSSDPNDKSSWIPTGQLNDVRRFEGAWYGDMERSKDAPRGTKFWSTQWGQIVSGPNDPKCGAPQTVGEKTYTTLCLEQYIAPTMPQVSFPGNSFQKTYPMTGVELPN